MYNQFLALVYYDIKVSQIEKLLNIIDIEIKI